MSKKNFKNNIIEIKVNEWIDMVTQGITTTNGTAVNDDFWLYCQQNLRYTFRVVKDETKYKCTLKQNVSPFYYNGNKITFSGTSHMTTISDDYLPPMEEVNETDFQKRLDISYYHNSEINDERINSDRQFKEQGELLELLVFEDRVKSYLKAQLGNVLLFLILTPDNYSESYQLGNDCGIKLYTKLNSGQFHRILDSDVVLKGDKANAIFPVPMNLHLSEQYDSLNITKLLKFSFDDLGIEHIIKIDDRIKWDQMGDCQEIYLIENGGSIQKPKNKMFSSLSSPKEQKWFDDIFTVSEKNDYGLLVALTKYTDQTVLYLPTGKRELAETALEAAMREFYEETKVYITLDLDNLKFSIRVPSETDANIDDLSTNVDSLSLNESNCLLTNLASPTSDSRKTEQECEFLYHRNPQAGTDRFLIRVLP